MPDYAYSATDARGQIVSGIRFAGNEAELAAQLKLNGLLLLDFKGARSRKLLQSLANMQLGGVSRRDLVEFSRNMGVMIKAGVSVLRSLDELREDTDNPALRKVLTALVQAIQEGSSLDQAMARHPKVFPSVYRSVIEIGENTGRLDAVFFDLARHLKRIDDLIRDVRKALIYPAFVMVAMCMAAFVFLVIVFPPLLEMLLEFKVELPLITRIVMAVSSTLKNSWPHLLLGLAALTLLVIIGRRNKKTRYYFDWCELHLPLINKVFIQLRFTFFMRYMAMLLSAGVDILRGLDLSIHSVNNLFLEKKLALCRQQIIEGGQLSAAFKNIRLVPNMVTRMVAVGEETGTLDEQMELVADQYNEELSRRITVALALMEPILIFMLAGLAMAMVMGVLLPLYDLVSQLSSQAGGG